MVRRDEFPWTRFDIMVVRISNFRAGYRSLRDFGNNRNKLISKDDMNSPTPIKDKGDEFEWHSGSTNFGKQER